MNHSCDPNTYVVGRNDVALRGIAPGEEVTSDYMDLEAPGSACNCGSAKCRDVAGVRYALLQQPNRGLLSRCVSPFTEPGSKLDECGAGKSGSAEFDVVAHMVLSRGRQAGKAPGLVLS